MAALRVPRSIALVAQLTALLVALAACGVRGPTPTSQGSYPAPAPTVFSDLAATATPSPAAADAPTGAPLGTDTPTPAAADAPTGPPLGTDTSTPAAPAQAATDTPTPATGAAATDTPTPAAVSAPCAYSWAYQEAPEVAERARLALENSGMRPAYVSAQAYGETCGQAGGGGGFLAMGTTIEAELPVPDLVDRDALGEVAAQVTAALSDIGETPGLEREARLFFTAGGERRALKFSLRIARHHIAAGLTGAALLEALGYQE